MFVIVKQHWEFDDACSVLRTDTEEIKAFKQRENAEKECKKLNLEAFKNRFVETRENDGVTPYLNFYTKINMLDNFPEFTETEELEQFLTQLDIPFSKGWGLISDPELDLQITEIMLPKTISDKDLEIFCEKIDIKFFEVKKLED